MKKFIISILTCVGLLALCSVKTKAVEHKSNALLYGQNLAISNNVTVTYSQVGLYYISPGLTNVLSLVTNSVNGVTNIVPGAFIAANSFSDALGQPNSTLTFNFIVNRTNIVNLPNQNVGITTNMTNLFTPTSASTNTLTFTLARSCNGTTNFGTTANDYIQLVVNAGGVAGIIQGTNLPTSFTGGAKAFAITSIVSSAATSSPGVILNGAWISGYNP